MSETDLYLDVHTPFWLWHVHKGVKNGEWAC